LPPASGRGSEPSVTVRTAAALNKLSIGVPLEIKLSKDGFADTEQTITLTDDNPSGAMSLTLKHGTFGVDVTFRPVFPGAAVTVDGKASPTSVDGLIAGEQHRLVAWAPGYVAQTFTLTGANGDHKHYDVTLMKLDPKAKNQDNPGSGGATGKISVGARGGWCNVAIDGAGRGPTPVAGIQVSAGSHTVTCAPPDGKTMSAVVNVPADGTARYAFTIPN